MITKPGIYTDIPPAEYLADPCPTPSFTQSIAKVLIDRSPLHAWHEHPRLGRAQQDDDADEKYVPAQVIGNAAHLMMIGRGRDLEVFDAPNWNATGMGKGAKTKLQEDRDAALAKGRIVILQKHFVRARNMVQIAQDRLNGAAFRADAPGRGEVVLAWQEGDLWFRTMIDWLDNDLRTAWDFKTTALSCAPHALSALMLNGGWDIQAAMHERALDALDPAGRGKRKHRFVAQENEAPYSVSVCELTEAVLTMGRKKLDVAISLWSACMAGERWPSYPDGMQYPEYPGWAEAKWLQREIAEAAHERMPVNLLAAG